MSGWYLEGFMGGGETTYRIPLLRFPALVGRQIDLPVCLRSHNVSRKHAEFTLEEGQLLLRDLDSTNGTFVNRNPVLAGQTLTAGDVVQFADVEFRLRRDAPTAHAGPLSDSTRTAFFSADEQVNRIPVGAQQFEQMLQQQLIKPLFQPIVVANDQSIAGLELLGRGCHPELSELPGALFFLADSLGRSVELSEALRDVGVHAWADSRFGDIPLFVNTHPRELKDCKRLIESLRRLRSRHPNKPLVLEIHEQAIADESTLRDLNLALGRLNIDLAYDDFGAGQARLLELLSIPPYAVKFDIALIRDLDKLPHNRRKMISLLVRVVKQGHALALAEGVSNAGELAVCRQLGFDLIQGFACGKPAALEELAATLYRD